MGFVKGDAMDDAERLAEPAAEPGAGPPLAAAEPRTHAGIAAEVGLGAVDGLGQVTVAVATSVALNTLTLGGYNALMIGKHLWRGYRGDGMLGAFLEVNPLYRVARDGAAAYAALERGDYRTASAAGVRAAVLGLGALFGANGRIKALGARKAPAAQGAGRAPTPAGQGAGATPAGQGARAAGASAQGLTEAGKASDK